MKVEIDVEIPDGYEATGEYRPPCEGDWFLNQYGHLEKGTTAYVRYPRLILREKLLRYEDFEKQDYVSVTSGGLVHDMYAGNTYSTEAARSLAAALIAAADHVDRVNQQKAGA